MEIEGGIWLEKGAHNTGKAIERDIEKYNHAQLLGWIVLRVVPSKVCTSETVQMLKTAVSLRSQKQLQTVHLVDKVVENRNVLVQLESIKRIVRKIETEITGN